MLMRTTVSFLRGLNPGVALRSGSMEINLAALNVTPLKVKTQRQRKFPYDDDGVEVVTWVEVVVSVWGGSGGDGGDSGVAVVASGGEAAGGGVADIRRWGRERYVMLCIVRDGNEIGIPSVHVAKHEQDENQDEGNPRPDKLSMLMMTKFRFKGLTPVLLREWFKRDQSRLLLTRNPLLRGNKWLLWLLVDVTDCNT
ncbi:hypothetical protein Tco_0734904 [Tanacetum coccineum]